MKDKPRILPHAPEELTRGRLRRLGEGVGKVVYASDHWVVSRERSPSEVLALIVVWKFLRRLERLLPGNVGKSLLERPSRQIRMLRVLVQAVVSVVPRPLWYLTHAGEMWRIYTSRGERGESLAQIHLAGTDLVPQRITFPRTNVKVWGWPGWLDVEEATERVEATLHQRLEDLAKRREFAALETWLNRFLELRQRGWRRGVFSVDAHLKNFGVSGERIVLLDAGGLTDSWAEIERHLSFEEVVSEPHIQLGLGMVLAGCPDVAARFNSAWKATVNRDRVRSHWPDQRLAS